jgi:ABC-type multidrug transport system fused ATPase/permease subunit
MIHNSTQIKTSTSGSDHHFNWRIFLPLLKTSRFSLVIGMASLLTSTLLVVWASVLLGSICAGLGTKSFEFPAGWSLIVGFVALEILSIGAQFLGRRLLASGTNQVLLDLRVALFKKLNELE